jgi:hypothetical protein
MKLYAKGAKKFWESMVAVKNPSPLRPLRAANPAELNATVESRPSLC